MIRLLLICFVVACVSLPHVAPALRSPAQQQVATVRITTSCGDWGGGYASGVVLTERHILTAAHVVRCPYVPNVRAHFSDGRVFSVSVIRDDAMFGGGTDLAILESSSAENFSLGVAPPTIGHFPTDRLDTRAVPGQSGSGVYSDGFLVGIVITEWRMLRLWDLRNTLPGQPKEY